MKATALATVAERTTTAAPRAADTPWRWNARDVWLTRIRQPRDAAIWCSMNDATITPGPDVAAHR